MPKLPVLTSKKLIKIIEKLGFHWTIKLEVILFFTTKNTKNELLFLTTPKIYPRARFQAF